MNACPTNRYIEVSGVCLKCDATCSTCTAAADATKCTSCFTMYMNFIDSTKRDTNNSGNCVNSSDKCS